MKRKATTPAELVSQAEYARRRKVTRAYINKLSKNGVLIMRDGKVDVVASDLVLDDRSKVTLDPDSDSAAGGELIDLSSDPKNYAEARFTREVYTGRLRKLEYLAKNKSLIPAADVAKEWAKIAESVKQRLTALPAKLAPVLTSITEEKQIRKTLELEINAALRALAAEVRIGY